MDPGSTRRLVLRILFGLLFVYILIFTISYTLEYQVNFDFVRFLTGTRIMLLAVGGCYLWLIRENLVELLDPFAACLLLIIVSGALSGLLDQKDWLTYFRHFFQYAFLLAFYLLGRDVACRSVPEGAVKILSSAILCGYMVATAIYVATPGLQLGGYSFQPNLALLSVASSLATSNWVGSVVGCLVVVIGDKRAVYLGLSLIIAVYIAVIINRRSHRTKFERLAIIVVGTPIVSLGLGVVVTALGWAMMSYGNVRVATVVERFTLEPTYNGGAEATAANEAKVSPLVRLTSARNIEAEAVWNLVSKSPYQALFGNGFGSKFTVRYISPNNYKPVEFSRDQADLAPVHVALTSGLPLAIVFTVLLSGLIFASLIKVWTAVGVDLTMTLFSIGTFVDSLLGFQATNPLCWMALGIVSRSVLPNVSLAWLARSPTVQQLPENA